MLVGKGYNKIFRSKTAIFLVVFIFAGIILLTSSQAMAQISLGLPDDGFAGAENADPKVVIENIVRVVFGIIGVILVLFIIYGGWLWFTSRGDEKQIEQAKKVITATVVGLIITVLAYVIAGFIISSIGGCIGPGVSSGPPGPGPGPGGTALGRVIESHYPGVNAKNIPRNTRIVVTFKEPMDVTTFNMSTVVVENLNTLVADPLTAADVTVTNTADKRTFTVNLNPAVLLGSPDGDTRYQVSLTSGIKKDSGGSALTLGYTWRFTVSSSSDVTAPTVTSVIPIGSDISRNTLVQINFSEEMNPATVSGSTSSGFNGITVTGGTSGLAQGTYTIGNQYRTVEFQTDDECGTNSCGGTVFCLAASDSFNSVVVGAPALQAVTDMAGNALAADYTWTFSTADSLDLTPPMITRQDPTHNSSGVTASYPVTIEFSKPMSISSLNSSNIELKGDNGVGYWLDAVTAAGQTVTTVNHFPFDAVSNYSVEVSSRIKDVNQNCYSPCRCEDPGGTCRCSNPDPALPCDGTECTALPTP